MFNKELEKRINGLERRIEYREECDSELDKALEALADYFNIEYVKEETYDHGGVHPFQLKKNYWRKREEKK